MLASLLLALACTSHPAGVSPAEPGTGAPPGEAEAAHKAALRTGCTVSAVDHDFESLFTLGERCGRLLRLDLAISTGMELPPGLREIYFDGLGHGLTAPEDPVVFLETVDQSVPAPLRPMLVDGMLRAITEAEGGDPARVLPKVEALMPLIEGDVYNGVRVGLQRSRGHALDEAIALARGYPKPWWRPLMEELGWRAGNDSASTRIDVAALAAAVPAEARCAFLQGAARGHLMKMPPGAEGWAATRAFIEGFPSGCERQVGAGLGWGLSILYGPEDAARGLDLIDVPALQQAARAVATRARGGPLEPIWGP